MSKKIPFLEMFAALRQWTEFVNAMSGWKIMEAAIDRATRSAVVAVEGASGAGPNLIAQAEEAVAKCYGLSHVKLNCLADAPTQPEPPKPEHEPVSRPEQPAQTEPELETPLAPQAEEPTRIMGAAPVQEEPTRIMGAPCREAEPQPEEPAAEQTRVMDAGMRAQFPGRASHAAAEEGTRVMPAAARRAQPISQQPEPAYDDEEEYEDERDSVAEALIRWVPPITAIVCAAVALCGFVYYQFVL